MRGIYQYPDGRFRVRLTRDRVTYMIGWATDLEQAKRLRDDWVKQYSQRKNFDKYTPKWFEEERRRQHQLFLQKYGSERAKRDRNSPKLILVNRTITPYATGIDEYLKKKL